MIETLSSREKSPNTPLDSLKLVILKGHSAEIPIWQAVYLTEYLPPNTQRTDTTQYIPQ